MDTNKIYNENCMDTIRRMPDGFIDCVVTSPPRESGRFKSGYKYSQATQFKKGQHWRKKKPFWDKEWMHNEYTIKQRSALDIANEFNVTEGAILFWLKKHDIKRRTISEARSIKHWGASGKNNPMYGKRGKDSHSWRGGVTADRQLLYVSIEWKKAARQVWRRDKALCRECGTQVGRGDTKHAIHHIVSFEHKELRCDLNNLVLLCKDCHIFIHSKKNITKKHILTYEQYIERYGVGGNGK